MHKGLLIGLGALIAAGGCGQSLAQDGGPTVQRSYQVGGFERIDVAGPYEVRVRTGSAPSVSASGPQGLIDRMVVEVKGDRLFIHPRKENGVITIRKMRGRAILEVTVPRLNAASIAGSGAITVDKVSGAKFAGSVAGSGDLNVESLQVQALSLSVAGSGDVRVAGQARKADYSIAGSGDIEAGSVRADTASVSIAGSGRVNGHASGTASVSIMGSGDVALTGGAKCSVSKLGSGNVRCS